MKTAIEYLNSSICGIDEANRATSLIAYADALRAIETALTDAAEYKYLLLRALRHHTTTDKAGRSSDEATIRSIFAPMNEMQTAA